MNVLLASILAATTVFRLELTDEVPFIVGADGERREVVIVPPDAYAALTGRLDIVWKSMNSTENGRIKIHGKCVDQTVDEKESVKHTVYQDGFVFTEKMIRKSTRPVIVDGKKPSRKLKKPNRVSQRHWEMMKKRIEQKQKPVKEVTVEHDATTGKDIVK